MGKGQKERIAPLWPETAELLTALLRRTPRLPEETLFMNRYGEPLTASGFRFRLRQYVKGAIKKVPSLSEKRVTPHLFRHTTAVHLVAAGVDVTVIRSWLGHADLETTNHYAQANLETKRKALEQADPKLRPAQAAAVEARCRCAGLAGFTVITGAVSDGPMRTANIP